MKGTTKWFSAPKGIGFITGEDGNDIFVHYSALQMEGFKTLRAHDAVEYDIGHTEDGRTTAVNVRKIEA